MARKVSNFTLGLFVVTGLIIGVAAVVWLGASRYFKKGYIYVTFFDESVQGLQADSAVKYRGVDVGRVKKILVAPDHRLIEVVMTLYRKDVVRPDTVAQKSLTGLSGASFVGLSPGSPGELARSPKTGFSVKYPVIPSKPSRFDQILSETDRTIGNMKQFDFKGLSDQMKATAKSMQDFLTDPRMDRIMAHLDTVAAHLDDTTRKIDRMVAEGDVKDVLAETRKTLSDTRDLIAGMRGEIKAMDLPETAGNANRLMEGLDRRTIRLTQEMRFAVENLEETSGSLDRLIERLNAKPSDIICGKPLPARTDEK